MEKIKNIPVWEKYTLTIDDVLTPDDVIKILNIGRNKVYEMLNNGTLRSIRIGRKHRIPKKILIEYLENS